MNALFSWGSEHLRNFRASMKHHGSRAWLVICRTDKKLEAAFCRMLFVVLILLVPILLFYGVVIGIVIGTLLAIFALLKMAFSHKQQPSKRERR